MNDFEAPPAEQSPLPAVNPKERLSQVEIDNEAKELIARIQALQTSNSEPAETYNQREEERLKTRQALFGEVFELTSPTVYGVLFKMYKGDREFTAEVMQEAYLKAWRFIDGYQFKSRATSWLTTVAINLSFNMLQKEKRHTHVTHPISRRRIPIIRRHPSQAYPDDDIEHFDVIDSSTDLIYDRADERLDMSPFIEPLISSLRVLDEKSRTIVILKTLHGLTHAEIAESMDMTEGNVKVRYHRAMTKLLKLMGPELTEEFKTREDDTIQQPTVGS